MVRFRGARVGCVLLIAVTSGLTGCGPGGLDGALSVGDVQATLCTAESRTGAFTDGTTWMVNRSGSPLSVTKAELEGVHEIDLQGVYVAPIEDDTAIGFLTGWPPSEGPPAAFNKKQELPVTVPAKAHANLVLHLRAHESSEYQRIRITYDLRGRERHVSTTMALQVRKRCY